MFFKAFTRLLHREPAPPVPVRELLGDLARVESFPTLSDTSLRVMAHINDPDATLAGLAELIRRDGVLTVAVLRLANSAAYRGTYPTQDVGKAAARLGMRGCQRVAAAVGVRDVFRHRIPQVAESCEVLLRHSLFTAMLASRLSAAARLGFRGEEFTAGLLHDIGRVILCCRAPAVFARADPLTFREDAETPARERDAVNTDHCEIGARFAQANQLPASVAGAILNHHRPEAEKGHPVLVALTATADALANHVQRERNVANFRPERAAGFVRLQSLVGADATAAMRGAASAAVVAALRETRALLRVAGQ